MQVSHLDSLMLYQACVIILHILSVMDIILNNIFYLKLSLRLCFWGTQHQTVGNIPGCLQGFLPSLDCCYHRPSLCVRSSALTWGHFQWTPGLSASLTFIVVTFLFSSVHFQCTFSIHFQLAYYISSNVNYNSY